MFTTGQKIILNEIIKINVWFFQLLQISFFHYGKAERVDWSYKTDRTLSQWKMNLNVYFFLRPQTRNYVCYKRWIGEIILHVDINMSTKWRLASNSRTIIISKLESNFSLQKTFLTILTGTDHVLLELCFRWIQTIEKAKFLAKIKDSN